MNSIARKALMLASAAITLAIRGVSAQTFEGAITMRTGGPGGDGMSQQIEYLTRGGKVRINMVNAGRTSSIISVPADKKMYMLMDAQSMYVEMSMDAAVTERGRQQANERVKAAMNAPPPKVTRTGKKEMIAGYECEHVVIASEKETFDMCLSKALGPYVGGGAGMGMLGGMGRGGAASPAWQKSLGDANGFPLKVTDKDGTVSLEVVKVDKRSIPAAQFEIPGNYTKMALPTRPRP